MQFIDLRIVRDTALLLLALLALPAPAQPVNAAWLGTWRLEQSNLSGTPDTFRVERNAEGQFFLVSDQERCAVRYDGLIRQSEIQARLDGIRAVQLDARNWPAGTKVDQLVGLKREFDQAQAVLSRLPADSYRRLRADCASVPASKADRFFVLSDGKRLFEIGFPVDALGLWVEMYVRAN